MNSSAITPPAGRASDEDVTAFIAAHDVSKGFGDGDAIRVGLNAVFARRASLSQPSTPDDTALVAQMAAVVLVGSGESYTALAAVRDAIDILAETRRQLAEGGR